MNKIIICKRDREVFNNWYHGMFSSMYSMSSIIHKTSIRNRYKSTLTIEVDTQLLIGTLKELRNCIVYDTMSKQDMARLTKTYIKLIKAL